MASESITSETVKQRRLVIQAPGEAELVSGEETIRIGPYGILIRTSLSLVSVGTELSHFKGTSSRTCYPYNHNATVVGTVVAMGNAVRKMRGDLQIQQQVVAKGSHAAYLNLDVLSQSIAPIDALDGAAALFARLGGVAVAATSALRDHPCSSASVVGLGVVGQLVLRAARSIGGLRLAACDRHKNRRDVAQLDESILVVSAVGELPTSDVVLVACDTPGVLEDALSVTADRGRLVLVGAGGGPQYVDLAKHVFRRNVRLSGAHERWGDWRSPRDQMSTGLLLLADQNLNLNNGMYRRLPPSKAGAAYSDLLPFKEQYVAAAIDWTSEVT